MTLWDEHKQERRDLILTSARELIAEGGVENLSMRKLAKYGAEPISNQAARSA